MSYITRWYVSRCPWSLENITYSKRSLDEQSFPSDESVWLLLQSERFRMLHNNVHTSIALLDICSKSCG